MTGPKLALGLALLAGMAWQLWRASSSERVGFGVHGDFARRKEPITFWVVVVLYGLVFVILAYTMYSMGMPN